MNFLFCNCNGLAKYHGASFMTKIWWYEDFVLSMQPNVRNSLKDENLGVHYSSPKNMRKDGFALPMVVVYLPRNKEQQVYRLPTPSYSF